MMDFAGNCIAGVVCFALGVLARDVAQDYRDLKTKPARSIIELAPIWSRNCVKAGGFLYATQADGKEWKVRCYQPKGPRA